MAIDSAKKRKSIAAISLICIGPVVVPDGTIDATDRQVVGYSYSGIAAGEPVSNTADFVCLQNAAIANGNATATIAEGYATATIKCTG